MAIAAHAVSVNVAESKTMKLTNETLKQIIKEELDRVFNEEFDPVEESQRRMTMRDAFNDSVMRDRNPPTQPAGRFSLFGTPMNGRLEITFPGTTRFVRATLRQWRLPPEYVYQTLGRLENNGKKIKDIDPNLAAHLANLITDEDLKDPAVFAEFEFSISKYSWKNFSPSGK